MDTVEHTPTPYKIVGRRIVATDKVGEISVAEVFGPANNSTARFIVRACNCYEYVDKALLRILELAHDACESNEKESVMLREIACTAHAALIASEKGMGSSAEIEKQE